MQTKLLKKIMIVEDEEDIRTIIRFSLEKIGQYTVKICESGFEALESVEQFNPDLIVLDMMMPGLDGVQTMQALRKTDIAKSTPIVFLSAKVQPHEVNNYKKLGALDVISKPFNPVTLSKELQKIWEQPT